MNNVVAAFFTTPLAPVSRIRPIAGGYSPGTPRLRNVYRIKRIHVRSDTTKSERIVSRSVPKSRELGVWGGGSRQKSIRTRRAAYILLRTGLKFRRHRRLRINRRRRDFFPFLKNFVRGPCTLYDISNLFKANNTNVRFTGGNLFARFRGRFFEIRRTYSPRTC